MAFTYTYATLRQTMQDWMENDSTDYTNKLDEIIGLAELRIARESDLDIFRQGATATFTAGSKFLDKPSDYIIDRSFFVTDAGGNYAEVLRKDTSYLYQYWPNPATQALPKYFSDYDDTSFIVAPTPDQAYTVTLEYIKRVATLSASNTTNWFSLRAPDALLAACLLGSAEFNKSETTDLTVWDSEYTKAIARLTKEEMGRKRRTDGRFGEPRGTL